MSEGHFLTNEGLQFLHQDVEESELCVYDYFKLVCMRKDGDSMTAVKNTIKCIDAWIEGRTTALMREWWRHRNRYTELAYALVEWRPRPD